MATVNGLSTQSSIYTLVANLMTIERQPQVKLQSRLKDLQALDGIYGDVKTNLTALRTQVLTMTDIVANPFGASAAVSNNTSVLSASAGTSAAPGAHSVFVSCLAKNHAMVSDRVTRSDTSIRDTLGVGDQTFSITVSGIATSVTVSIDEQDTNEDVIAATAAAINAAMENVTDSVTATSLGDTATTSKLVLRSDATGLAQKMSLADVSGTLLQTLGIDDESVAAGDATGGYIHADGDLDAVFTLDGVSITRSTNVVSDVLAGLTLTFNAAQSVGDKAVSLTIGPDSAAIRSTADSFIDKYNTAIKHLRGKTAIDRATGARQPLASQTLYRNLINDLRTTVAQAVTTGVDAIRTLADIGITQDKDGNLAVSDAAAFEEAVAQNPAAIKALFTAGDGIATGLDAVLQPFVKAGGYVDGDKTNLGLRIQNVNSSISRMEVSLTLRQEQLIKQYSSLQEALAQLSGQSDYLGSFLNSLYS